MDTAEKHITISKKARYFTKGAISSNTKRIWLVLHGYGQLASYFIKHFEPLVDDDTSVVAVEGLSRFYLDGKWERVGASWMTKEDRLNEIEDYITYLDAVCAAVFEELEEQPEIVLLGFSQGTATAWRWLLRGKYKVSHLVLWAGSIGKENPELVAKKLQDCSLHLAVGDQDQFISMENAIKRKDAVKALKPDLHFWPFEGKHVMHRPTLEAISKKISE